jgi:hypothetical protein
MSLWHVLQVDCGEVSWFDSGEFDAVRWMTCRQVLGTDASLLDPRMHAFTRKLQGTQRPAT